jgi:predicted negative regulator of RcsB-dependent stress response
MLNMLTAPALTLMFLIVVIGLGSAFVWMFWEIEQMSRLRRMSRPYRKGDRIG